MTPADPKHKTEKELLAEAGKWLTPGPWEHDWTFSSDTAHADGTPDVCARCSVPRRGGKPQCPVPPPATGSLADVAEGLWKVQRNLEHEGFYAVRQFVIAVHKMRGERMTGNFAKDLSWAYAAWYSMEAREKIIVCLLALQEGDETE